MTPEATAPRPIEAGAYWLATKPNGHPEMGYARPGVELPERAEWWCRLGDARWTRVPGEGG